MSKARLDWALFEKAAAAVKQAGGQAGSQHAPEAVRGGGIDTRLRDATDTSDQFDFSSLLQPRYERDPESLKDVPFYTAGGMSDIFPPTAAEQKREMNAPYQLPSLNRAPLQDSEIPPWRPGLYAERHKVPPTHYLHPDFEAHRGGTQTAGLQRWPVDDGGGRTRDLLLSPADRENLRVSRLHHIDPQGNKPGDADYMPVHGRPFPKPSVGKPGDPVSRGTDSPHWYGNQPKPPSASLLDRLKSFFSTR